MTAIPVRLPAHGAMPPAGALTAPTVSALAKALREEEVLLRDLAQVLRHQRDALGRDDLEGLDDSVFATHRVLLTLGEARRRRQALNVRLGESDDLSLAAVEDAFGGEPPIEIRTALDALAVTGETLRREVELNQRVLRVAVEACDQLVRALCGTAMLDRRI